MPAVVLHLEAHVLDIRRAEWCDTCLLPSRVEADIALVWADSLRVFKRFTSGVCSSCGT